MFRIGKFGKINAFFVFTVISRKTKIITIGKKEKNWSKVPGVKKNTLYISSLYHLDYIIHPLIRGTSINHPESS